MNDLRAFYSFLSTITEQEIQQCAEALRERIGAFLNEGVLGSDPTITLFVMQLATGKCLFVSDSIVKYGFDQDRFYNEGPAYIDTFFFPEDIKVKQEKLEPNLFRIITGIDPLDLINWHFSWNFRMMTPSGEVKRFMHNHYVVVNEQNIPFLVFSKVIDASDFVSDNKITFVSVRQTEDGQTREVVDYFPCPGFTLSNREKEILLFMQKGYTSREIARQFFLSPNTVNNHRRNMLRKAGVKNTTELIQKAVKVGDLKQI